MSFRQSGRTARFVFVVPMLLVGCMPPSKEAEAAPPPPAPYKPNFSYKANAASQKLDVTLGVINPQFSQGADLYKQASGDDVIVKEMLSAMGATFAELLVAKGFNTKGPFVSLNDMTFPEKKGADLLLYPEFDFQVQLQFENQRDAAPEPPPESEGGMGSLLSFGSSDKKEEKPATPPPPVKVCDGVLSVTGNMLFVAQEPLSGERMWVKRLDVSKAKQVFEGQKGSVCTGSHDWPLEVTDAWAKAHEGIYQASMKALDAYINGEEFQMLKAQAQELRDKKTY